MRRRERGSRAQPRLAHPKPETLCDVPRASPRSPNKPYRASLKPPDSPAATREGLCRKPTMRAWLCAEKWSKNGRCAPAPGTGPDRGGSPGDTRVFICYAVKRLTYKTSFTSISDPARERPPADADPGTAHRSPSGTHPKVGGALCGRGRPGALSIHCRAAAPSTTSTRAV